MPRTSTLADSSTPHPRACQWRRARSTLALAALVAIGLSCHLLRDEHPKESRAPSPVSSKSPIPTAGKAANSEPATSDEPKSPNRSPAHTEPVEIEDNSLVMALTRPPMIRPLPEWPAGLAAFLKRKELPNGLFQTLDLLVGNRDGTFDAKKELHPAMSNGVTKELLQRLFGSKTPCVELLQQVTKYQRTHDVSLFYEYKKRDYENALSIYYKHWFASSPQRKVLERLTGVLLGAKFVEDALKRSSKRVLWPRGGTNKIDLKQAIEKLNLKDLTGGPWLMEFTFADNIPIQISKQSTRPILQGAIAACNARTFDADTVLLDQAARLLETFLRLKGVRYEFFDDDNVFRKSVRVALRKSLGRIMKSLKIPSVAHKHANELAWKVAVCVTTHSEDGTYILETSENNQVQSAVDQWLADVLTQLRIDNSDAKSGLYRYKAGPRGFLLEILTSQHGLRLIQPFVDQHGVVTFAPRFQAASRSLTGNHSWGPGSMLYGVDYVGGTFKTSWDGEQGTHTTKKENFNAAGSRVNKGESGESFKFSFKLSPRVGGGVGIEFDLHK